MQRRQHHHDGSIALVLFGALALGSCSGGGGGGGGENGGSDDLDPLVLGAATPNMSGSFLVLALNDPPLTEEDCDAIEIHHLWEISEAGGQLELRLTALDDSEAPQGMSLTGARTGAGAFRVHGLDPGTFLSCEASEVRTDGYEGVTFLDIELSLGDLFAPGCAGHTTRLRALAVPGAPSTAHGLDGDWKFRTAEHYSTNDIPGAPKKDIEVPSEFALSLEELGPNPLYDNGLMATHDFLGSDEPFIGGYENSDGLLVANLGDSEDSTVLLRIVVSESHIIGFGVRAISNSNPDLPPFLHAFYVCGQRSQSLLAGPSAWIELAPSPEVSRDVQLMSETLGVERTLSVSTSVGRSVEVPAGVWVVTTESGAGVHESFELELVPGERRAVAWRR